MSVCFFVPADQAGTSGVGEEVESDVVGEEISPAEAAQQSLDQFWAKVTDDIKNINVDHFKSQALPLARIKKIMKLDDEVKMISAEAPVLFAKAAEILIHELTLRAWQHTEDNKRRTLQRNDIAMAIAKCDQFDFLIDIVPRHEVKPNKPRYEVTRTNPPAEHAVQQQQASSVQNTSQPQIVTVQSCGQVVQNAVTSSSSSNNVVNQQPVTLMQQVVAPSSDISPIPIQLTQAQLNMIRMQLQNNPNQPVIIQATPQHQHQLTPQIIQVTSQAQHQPQQVYLAQVGATQEES